MYRAFYSYFYISRCGNMWMCCNLLTCLAVAQNASGQSSVTGSGQQQQQQRFANFMLQQQQQQQQMLMQQYSMAAAAQQLGQWSVNSNGGEASSPRTQQAFPFPFPDQNGSRARSVQSFPPHSMAAQFMQQQAAAQKRQDAARQHYQQTSLNMHSAPANGNGASAAPIKTANGATSRAPPMPQNGGGAGPMGQQALRMQHAQQQQQPGHYRPCNDGEAAEQPQGERPAEDAAAAGRERRAQVHTADPHCLFHLGPCCHCAVWLPVIFCILAMLLMRGWKLPGLVCSPASLHSL